MYVILVFALLLLTNAKRALKQVLCHLDLAIPQELCSGLLSNAFWPRGPMSHLCYDHARKLLSAHHYQL